MPDHVKLQIRVAEDWGAYCVKVTVIDISTKTASGALLYGFQTVAKQILQV